MVGRGTKPTIHQFKRGKVGFADALLTLRSFKTIINLLDKIAHLTFVPMYKDNFEEKFYVAS